MTQPALLYLPGATEGTTQWRAETMQVVNWGGFHGHTRVGLAFGSTLLSGASATGKSTLLDAYLALMMPADTPFNNASNDATTGRARGADQRNLLTYLRGKRNTNRESGRDELTDQVLRGGTALLGARLRRPSSTIASGGSACCGLTSSPRSQPAQRDQDENGQPRRPHRPVAARGASAGTLREACPSGPVAGDDRAPHLHRVLPDPVHTPGYRRRRRRPAGTAAAGPDQAGHQYTPSTDSTSPSYWRNRPPTPLPTTRSSTSPTSTLPTAPCSLSSTRSRSWPSSPPT